MPNYSIHQAAKGAEQIFLLQSPQESTTKAESAEIASSLHL